MSDIEKAIDDLDDLSNCDSINSSYFKGWHGKNLEVAIEALKKQIPKKPITEPDDSFYSKTCPVCFDDFTMRSRQDEMRFCPYCGQAIDWEED